MALSKNIPLKNLIFDEKSLSQILTILSEDYDANAARDSYQHYSFDVAEDSETLISVDHPPKAIAAFLENPIHRIRLSFDTSRPKKSVEFRIINGSHSDSQNYINISGENEEWVHSKHRNLRKSLDALDGHTPFFRKFEFLIGMILAMLIAFLLYRIEIIAFLALSSGKLPEKPTIISTFIAGFALFIPLILSGMVSFYFVDIFKSAYPSIEIRTGGAKHRIAERRRKLIKPIFGFLILTPILTFLEDVWKWFLVGK